jgi:hypothetical protein
VRRGCSRRRREVAIPHGGRRPRPRGAVEGGSRRVTSVPTTGVSLAGGGPQGAVEPCRAQHHTLAHSYFTNRRDDMCQQVRSVQWGTLGGQVSYLQCTVRYTPHCPVGQHSRTAHRGTGTWIHLCSSTHWGRVRLCCGSCCWAQGCTRQLQPSRVLRCPWDSIRPRLHRGTGSELWIHHRSST